MEKPRVTSLTFMHSHPTVVTLDNLIRILTVVTKTDAADEDVLSAPGLGPVLQSILGKGGRELQSVCFIAVPLSNVSITLPP